MSLANQFSQAVLRRVKANLIIAGEVVATEVRRNIQNSPRGGRTYIKINPSTRTRRIHKASAAGESPANDLGFLARSIQIEPDLDNLRVRILSLHSLAPYAKRLEFGDLSANLQPRPFFYKGLQAKTAVATAIIQQALNQAIRDMQGAQP